MGLSFPLMDILSFMRLIHSKSCIYNSVRNRFFCPQIVIQIDGVSLWIDIDYMLLALIIKEVATRSQLVDQSEIIFQGFWCSTYSICSITKLRNNSSKMWTHHTMYSPIMSTWKRYRISLWAVIWKVLNNGGKKG